MYASSFFQDLNINYKIDPPEYFEVYVSAFEQHVREYREFNEWMSSKKFQCRDEETINLYESNEKHTALRNCYKALQMDIGWRVAAESSLKVQIDPEVLQGGFYPAFEQSESDRTFLQNLTHEDLSESLKAGPYNTWVCYSANGKAKLMSPLWAGEFDAVSCPAGLSCGCDTYLDPDGTRLVDARCTEPDDQCAALFPQYHELINSLTPSQCKQLFTRSQPVAMSQHGSLDAAEVPLCAREQHLREDLATQTECAVAHGTLHQYTGESAASIGFQVQPSKLPGGLYSQNNDIFRYRRNMLLSRLTALAILDTDIGGHALEFEVTENGLMFFKCAHLQSNAQGSCDLLKNGNWLQNVNTAWSTQHRFMSQQWQQTPLSEAPSWKCPVRILTAYSNFSKPYAVGTQHAYRNQHRFQHITAPYNFAHPVASNIRRLQNLQKVRFLSDSHACSTAEDCHNKLQTVLQDLVAMAQNAGWKIMHIHHAEEMCQHILDWPHQRYKLRDAISETAADQPTSPCMVLDRLPSFALRYVAQNYEHLLEKPRVSAQNVCRMSTLKQLQPAPSWPENRTIQFCKPGDTSVRCVYLEGSDGSFVTGEHEFSYVQAYTRSKNQKFLRKRHCKQCDAHHIGYVHRTSQQESSDSMQQQLSFGIGMQLSTARMVAGYLKQHVCENTTACPNCTACLHKLFASDKWQKGNFLQTLLSLSSDSSTQTPKRNDDVLWNRPWLFCNVSEEGDINTGVCRGSVNRTAWLDPKSRGQACKQALQDVDAHEQGQLQFCLLDSSTEKLCNHVADWNSQIVNILCRAAGSCRDSGFHYVPHAYMVSNQKFVSESITAFYQQLDASVCQVTPPTESMRDQIAINNQLLQKCASHAMQPLRTLITLIRQIVRSMWQVVYFYLMIGTQFAQIVAGMFIQAIDAQQGKEMITRGFERMIHYVDSLLSALAEIFNMLIFAIWEMLTKTDGSFGKVLVQVLTEVCKAINWVKVKIMCRVWTWLAGILRDIGKEINKIPFCGSCGNFLIDAAEFLLKFVDNFLCSEMRCSLPECNRESGKSEYGYDCKSKSSGQLPLPSRCWSSYLTFFGDSDTLGCTAADTCKQGLLSTDNTVCGMCTANSEHFFAYGCNPITQLCTCNVPNYVETPCLSNEECVLNTKATCRLLDWDYMPSRGFTTCEACKTERVCYLNQETDERFCACGVQNTLNFAHCDPVDVGRPVPPQTSLLCPYDSSAQFARSTTGTAFFSTQMVTPCAYLDTSVSFCTNIPDQDSFLIVGTMGSYSQFRRRLLSVDSQPSITDTAMWSRSPQCQSAWEDPHATAIKQECLQWMQKSISTVSFLNASTAISGCTFCSRYDFWHELLHNPAFLPIALNMSNVVLVAQRHGILADMLLHFKTVFTKVRLIDDHWLSDTVSEWTNISEFNTSMLTHARSLLGFDAFLTASENMFTIHQDYSEAIAEVYDYRFGTESPAASDAWSAQWPPGFLNVAGSECASMNSLLEIMQMTANKTALPYTAMGRDMLSRPASTLQGALPSWNEDTNSDTDTEEESWVSQILTAFLKFCGIKRTVLTTVAKSLFAELEAFLWCDIDSVQVCSNWRVKIMHSLILVSGMAIITSFILTRFQLGVAGSIIVLLFVPLVMFVSYRVSPFCAPMIPTCMADDVLSMLHEMFPKHLHIPSALLHTELGPHCLPRRQFYDATCIRSCRAASLGFDGWEAVLAWWATETGTAAWVSDISSALSMLHSSKLERTLALKQQVYAHADTDLIMANRMCAVLHVYEIVPVLLVVLVLTASLTVFATLLPSVVYPIANMMSSLVISIFVQQ